MKGRKFKKLRKRWYNENVGWFIIQCNSHVIECDRHLGKAKQKYTPGSEERIIQMILSKGSSCEMFWYAWRKQFVFSQLKIRYAPFDDRFTD